MEYHDPSGVFSLLQLELGSRLPLRNLNWKSTSRPLRNIDALHVEFVPDSVRKPDGVVPTLQPGGIKRTASTHSSGKPSEESSPRPHTGSRSVSSPVGVVFPHRERRHQIPGLRQTAYLKLFILRCDDKEAYKAEHRQRIRDWVRDIYPSSTGTAAAIKNNDHDAFDWMIIHVVLPDTKAASEPRWTAAKKDPDELAERSKSKAKWASKKTTTVFDKLRSDFPPSTKGGLERVAQIRLSKDVVPQSLLPAIPFPSELIETGQEQMNAWNDVIAKFKTMILQSFDRRVSQYEDDIREKEAQRTLPGWNFCTFFTLKENLARGFESVGLVEDALAIYDELEAGLETATHNNTAFLGDMSKLQSEVARLSNQDSNEHGTDESRHRILDLLASPFEVNSRDFRSLIVSSTISLFDLHTYIFARQRLLIYRLGAFEPKGTADTDEVSSRSTISKPRTEEQLIQVAEVCQRATMYISTNTRTLKKELAMTLDASQQTTYDLSVQSIAASWASTMAARLLVETAISLQSPSSSANNATSANVSFGQGANPYPTRRSSLMALSNAAMPSGAKVIFESEKARHNDGMDHPQPAAPGSGLSELAAARGDLSLLQRNSLESIASSSGWKAGWAAVDGVNHGSAADVTKLPVPSAVCLDEDDLQALSSINAFRNKFEMLTSLATRYMILGNRLSSAETLFGDLALLKYQAGDFTGAAQIFSKLAQKYTNNRWSSIEARILVVYSNCLRKLNRKDEYVRMSLQLLRRQSAGRLEDNGQLISQLDQPLLLGDDFERIKGISLQELVEFSKDSQSVFRAPLDDLFDDLQIRDDLIHVDDQDGFKIRLSLCRKVDAPIQIDSIKLKLVNAVDNSQELWLETDAPTQMTSDSINAEVQTRTTLWGFYNVRQIIVNVAQLSFSHSFESRQKPSPFTFSGSSMTHGDAQSSCQTIMVYPRDDSLDVSVSTDPNIYVDRQRSFYVCVNMGSIAIDELHMRVKPATAGLRLHTAKAVIVKPQESSVDISNTHGMVIRPSATPVFTIKVPFSLESTQLDLSVKVEASYVKDGREYNFFFEEDVPLDLHLDVDVNDTFKPGNLYSQFSIRTTNEDPLIVDAVKITGSSTYTVKALSLPKGLAVLAKQPVSLACMISKTPKADSTPANQNSKALEFRVDYIPIADMIAGQVTDVLNYSIKQSEHCKLRRFLLPLLRRLLLDRMECKGLEEAATLGTFAIPSYDTLGWEPFLTALPTSTYDSLKSWLQSWHSLYPTLMLDLDALPESERRSITVPVEVPTIDVLATSTITIQGTDIASSTLPPIAYVGKPLEAILSIRTTHHWSSSAAQPSPPPRLTYNIPDCAEWLLAGPSSSTFSASDEPHDFPLLLIPLLLGPLLLPHVDVHLAASADGAPSPAAPGRYACESDYESAAQTVLVLRPAADVDFSISDPVVPSPLVGLGGAGAGALHHTPSMWSAVGLGVRLEGRESEDVERRVDDGGKWWMQE